MILITGGVYQGKKQLAIHLSEELNKEINILDSCDKKIRKQLDLGKKSEEIFEFWTSQDWSNTILIFNDVSMGIVPMEKKERIFRETVGKIGVALAEKADSVYRVFCGISKKIK